MGFSFFTNKDIKNKLERESANLDLAYKNKCKICTLKDLPNKSKKMKPTGSKTPLIYILGEAPGKEEDYQGVPFVGRSGSYLRNTLKQILSDKDIKKYVRFNNTVRCRPEGNRNPSNLEMACCLSSIEEDIQTTKPEIILGFGNISLKWAVGVEGMVWWRNRMMPIKVGNHSCWFFPLYHPSYIITKKSKDFKNEHEQIFKYDMETAINYLDSAKYKKADPEDINEIKAGIDDFTIDVNNTLKNLEETLIKFQSYSEVSVDIETTGFKPWDEGAKLLTISISTDKDFVVFPVEHPSLNTKKQKEIKKLLNNFLLNSGTKICHNVKFELLWFLHYFGEDILRKTSWADTMAQAYVLDERSGVGYTDQETHEKVGILSLNCLVLQYFGFKLKSLFDIDISNLIVEDLQKVLKYNLYDTLYTYRLYQKQKEALSRELMDIYDQHVETSKSLAKTETVGVLIDQKRLVEIESQLGDELVTTENEIYALPECQEFFTRYGKEMNVASTKDLAVLFEDILKIPPIKKTPTGKYCTNKEVLEVFAERKVPFAVLLSERRGLAGDKKKYVDNIPYLISNDGYLRANFNSMFTATGRLSCSSKAKDDTSKVKKKGLNFQNYPKKNRKFIRSCVVAPENHYFVAIDYGQLEARMLAIVSQDRVFREKIINGYDIHMEWAEKIDKRFPNIRKDKTMKEFRDAIKNQVVFPWFYLSSYASVGKALGVPLSRIKVLYDEFWEEFSGVKKWQRSKLKFYRKHQFIKARNGRRRRGPLTSTRIANSNIQSLASDIVVNAMNRLSLLAYQLNKPQLQAILNIHDDLSFYLPEATIEEDLEMICSEMTKPTYDFIDIPLSVEVSYGDNWYDLEDGGTFDSRDFGWM